MKQQNMCVTSSVEYRAPYLQTGEDGGRTLCPCFGQLRLAPKVDRAPARMYSIALFGQIHT